MLTGEYRAALDEKGRILIPTKLRTEIQGETMVLTKGPDRCLWLFSSPRWEVFSRTVQESVGMFSPRDLMIQRRIIGSALEVEIDKAGRIGVSALLREHAGLLKDCIVVGIRNFLELWDEQTYTAYQKLADEQMPDLVQNLTIPWPKE
ncbi:MAG: division/cell wall cluster transcriptional repressor MraZ [Spirochaetales bacterium]|nr:division/cell wall cluster transcriptional repressor MraZ [Spirochaetales bacterium]